jgi:hypothetical protein
MNNVQFSMLKALCADGEPSLPMDDCPLIMAHCSLFIVNGTIPRAFSIDQSLRASIREAICATIKGIASHPTLAMTTWSWSI